ncbi:MAG: phosphomevalonate kinase [Candidatus Aenigmarchaeota archaeon]|nr:phosphomevalonate kinase [Candidatus Aenigmarchaeota archaeon]
MLKVSAPGKLMIAGEWAVLELGHPCIVAAVNRRVHSEIKNSEKYIVSLPEFGIENTEGIFYNDKFSWNNKVDEEKLMFTKSAIETALGFLEKSKPFNLISRGEDTQISMNSKLKKIGFGSSAAAVVSNISAILELNGVDISKKESKDTIYKLSALAHYYAQGKLGSAFDIAASVYGEIIVYRRFDAEQVVKKIESGASIKDIVSMDWPGLFVEELKVPEGLNLNIFWTGDSASTPAMIKQMGDFKISNVQKYNKICSQIKSIVNRLIDACKNGNRDEIIRLLNANEEILRTLTKESGVNIETEKLKQLSEIAKKSGAAGKLSGAGGGDCGIVICFSKNLSEEIRVELEKENLIFVDAKIDNEGVKLENNST